MKITVVGAYGYTGRLICQALTDAGYRFTAAGRDGDQLNELKATFSSIDAVDVIDLTDETACADFVSKFDFFINCAGPFTEESNLFLEKIANSSAKFYVDISGEIEFVRQSHDRYHTLAQSNQTTLIHGCAFESLIAHLGWNLIKPYLPTPDSIKTYYQFSRSRPSPGTKMTMKLSNLRTLYFVKAGKWQIIQPELDQETFKIEENNFIAVPYPLPELAFFNWENPLITSGSYLLVQPEEALFIGRKTNQDSDLETVLTDLKLRKGKGPTADERAKQSTALIIEAKTKNGQEISVQLSGNDMYLITANAVVKVLKQIENGRICPTGVISPARFFENKEAETLEEFGFKIVMNAH